MWPEEVNSSESKLIGMRMLDPTPIRVRTDSASSPSLNKCIQLSISTSPSDSTSSTLCDSSDDEADSSIFDMLSSLIQPIDIDLSMINLEPLHTHMSIVFGPDKAPWDCHKQLKPSSLSSSRRWEERFEDLRRYKERFGHCCVPSQWPESPPLAQWVKRQRYQLKLRLEGQHSTMNHE